MDAMKNYRRHEIPKLPLTLIILTRLIYGNAALNNQVRAVDIGVAIVIHSSL